MFLRIGFLDTGPVTHLVKYEKTYQNGSYKFPMR